MPSENTAMHGEPAFYRQASPSKGDDSGFSYICFFTIQGMKAVRGYDVNVKADMFLFTLQHDVLPLMNPFPQKNSIILLDNARVHKKQEILDMCAPFGVKVMFLPPYSYDYNPIELAFHSTKALLRKGSLEGNIPGTLFDRMIDCLWNCCTADQACNMFQHCSISVTADERDWACC